MGCTLESVVQGGCLLMLRGPARVGGRTFVSRLPPMRAGQLKSFSCLDIKQTAGKLRSQLSLSATFMSLNLIDHFAVQLRRCQSATPMLRQATVGSLW